MFYKNSVLKFKIVLNSKLQLIFIIYIAYVFFYDTKPINFNKPTKSRRQLFFLNSSVDADKNSKTIFRSSRVIKIEHKYLISFSNIWELIQ